MILTKSPPGRRPMTNAKLFTLRLTPDDRAYIGAVQSANGLPDLGSTLRFAVRELARRDRLKVSPAPKPEGAKEGE